MDRKELFRSTISDEVKRAEKRRKEATAEKTQKDKETAKKNADKERLVPFSQLEDRNKALVKKVKEVTSNGQTWEATQYRTKCANKTGVLVILEPAPKSQVTPDHVAVCLLSYVSRTEVGSRGRSYAEFRFAFIPSSTLEDAIESSGYPLGIIPEEDIITRSEHSYDFPGDEIMRKGRDVNSYTSLRGGLRYKKVLRECISGVENEEQNLAWVMEAASNPELNPHLQSILEPSQHSEV